MVKNKITPELLQKIKDSVNIVDVVGEHVVLRKSGSNHTGLCPFHSERSPSFSVSEQKQLYHCYGCKKGGDLVSFTMAIHGLSFPETVEELADRARIALPKDWAGNSQGAQDGENPEVTKRRNEQREKTALAHKLNRFAASFFHQQLKKSPPVVSYFRTRGITPDLERDFYVGAAPGGWDGLSRFLKDGNAPLPLAVELGLIRPSQKGPVNGVGYFDLFRGRAMFPILDLRGKVVGFGGRLMESAEASEEADRAPAPKYLNSPESMLFYKNKLLFGLYQAQKHIRERDVAIIVEGYFDVTAMHAAGFTNAVATCGTSLTPDHLTLLKRFCSKIIVLFDGDRAGIAATERAMELGLDQGWILHGTRLPDELDPDELVFTSEGTLNLDGVKKLTALLESARPLLDERIDEQVALAHKGPEDRAQALKLISAWVQRLKDPIGQAVRVEHVAKQLQLSGATLQQAFGALGNRVQAGASRNPQGRSIQNQNPRNVGRPGRSVGLSQREKILLAAVARGGEFARIIGDARPKFPPELTFSDLFDYSPAREWVDRLFTEPGVLEAFRATPENFLGEGMDAQVRSTLMEALIAPEAPFEESELKLALDRSLSQAWARFSQHIKSALGAAEAKQDAELQSKLMKEYLDVQRKMKEFNCFYDEG